MMKTAALIFVTLTAASNFARAEDKVIIDVPGVRISPPRVDIERRDRPVERRVIETDGRGRGGCETKTITKREPGETKTVTKENCGGGS